MAPQRQPPVIGSDMWISLLGVTGSQRTGWCCRRVTARRACALAAAASERLFFPGMDKPVDRLRQLDCFRRVIEHGSISAAARALGVGQPAVSKQLRALEERLGVRLLERSTRGLEATPAGSGLYAGLPRLLEELDMLEDDVAASARGLS